MGSVTESRSGLFVERSTRAGRASVLLLVLAETTDSDGRPRAYGLYRPPPDRLTRNTAVMWGRS